VLLTLPEVEAAVADLMRHPHFVIDVETTSLNARTNTVTWIGLGAYGSVYMIPMGHTKGCVKKAKHKAKTPAFFFYGPLDRRSYTPGTQRHFDEGRIDQAKPSYRAVEHWVEATYFDPPKQLRPEVVIEALRPLLFSDRGKIGHNVKFDLSSLSKYYKKEIPGPYHDTVLVRHTLTEDLMSYELKPLVWDTDNRTGYLGIPRERYPELGKQGVENFGLDEVARYLAKDVYYCWLMFQRFFPRLSRSGLQGAYEFEMQVYPVIMRMEQHGFPVDLTQLASVKADLEKAIRGVEEEAWSIAGDQFTLSDPAARRWVLFGEGIPEYGVSKKRLKTQKLKVLVRTPKKKEPAATAAVLEWHAERGNRMAELLAEWATLDKLYGTFVGRVEYAPDDEPEPDEDRSGIYGFLNYHNGDLPTIHTGYKQHGTVTGRLSAAKPNLQQLPRGSTIRNLFVAGEGYRLIVADYDQVELRCAAYLSGDRNMLQTFQRGDDIHRRAAAAMFNCSLAEVTDDMRAVGKTQNFAVLYGAGPGKIAAVAHCSMERAEELIDAYFRAFPMLDRWKDKELQMARKRGDRANPLSQPPHVVIPPYGRMRRLPDLFVMDGMRDDNGDSILWRKFRAERQAINALVQGFASYITKMAMIDLDRDVPHPLLAQVHDEIILRVPEDEAYKVLPLVTEIMGGITDPFTGEPILGEIPLVASAAIGTSWADAKKKAA